MRDNRKRSLGTCALAILFFLFQVAVSQGQVVAPTPPIVPIRPVAHDKVVLQIYESTLNKFAAAVLPVTYSGHYTFSACVYDDEDCQAICSSDWQATVKQIQFAIAPAGIRLTGTGDVTWCHLSVGINLDTTVNVALQTSISVGAAPLLQSPAPVNPSASITSVPPSSFFPLPTQTSIQVTVSPTNVQPVFNISALGQKFTVPLPFHLDIAPMLNLPLIPLTATPVTLDTADGPIQLQLVPSQFTLSVSDHYLELQSTMQLH